MVRIRLTRIDKLTLGLINGQSITRRVPNEFLYFDVLAGRDSKSVLCVLEVGVVSCFLGV
jgi:hypothetical protein